MIVEELIGLLGWRLEGEQDLKKFKSGMDDAEGSAKRTSDRVKALGIAAGAVATGAIAIGTSAVKNYASFERSMLRIGTTAGSTVAETMKASEDVQALAKRFALPLDEAVNGLETLTSAGQSLQEAMSFLPAVLATAQASGSATADIANTALKSSSALKIQANDLQTAFDIMVAGGKAGQFELKDMAAYIPTLANQFANLGYDGTEGLKRLIAVLQTLREDTGSAGQAATNAENLFTKMFSGEVEKNFKGFGKNIREEMASATAAGEDAINAYVRLTKEVLEQNPTARLSDIFVDTQLQNAMLSLTTSTDALQNFFDILNGTEVNGTVYRDVKRFTDDTTAAIQNMTTAWDGFMKALGGSIAPSATSGLNSLTNEISYQDAVSKELERQGYSFLGRQLWMGSKEEKDVLARAGGYVPNSDSVAQEAAKNAPQAFQVLGRRPRRPGQVNNETSAWDRFLYGAAADPNFSFKDHMGISRGGTAAPEVTNTVNDSRNQSVTVQVGGVTVQGVQNVNAAVGGAVGRAVGQAAVGRASRFEKDDAF